MIIDYHTHNHFSSDSETETKEIAKKAVSLGIKEICITNHIETFPPAGGKGSFSYEEASGRFAEIKKDIDETHKEFPDLPIRFGVELEYVEEWMPEMKRFVKNTDFDFLIGSVHEVENNLVSSSKYCQEYYRQFPENHTYTKYFETMYRLVEWGYFSVIGHFDICKKGGIKSYGPFKPEKYKDLIIPILELAKQKGIGLELNASGLRYDCNEIFPHPDILKWAVEIGVEHYTIGSDGHKAEEIGQNLDKALQLAKEVGIKTLSTYSKGTPTKFNI